MGKFYSIVKYNKENTVLFTLRLNKKYDADIIEFFNKIQNDGCKVGTYLKVLLRHLIQGRLMFDPNASRGFI